MGPEKSIAEKAIKAYEIASLVNRCLLAVQSELAKETQTDDIKMVNQVTSIDLKSKDSAFRKMSFEIMYDFYISKKQNLKANDLKRLINEN